MALKTYLGDSVYAEYRPYTNLIQVYCCNDGKTKTNIIYFDAQVAEAFIAFVQRIKGNDSDAEA